MSRKREPKEEFQPGDGECSTCMGLNVLTEAMKLKKKGSMCIGYRSVKGKIAEGNLDQFERDNATRDNKDTTAEMAIGYSLSTKRMDRTGKPPIMLSGFILALGKPENVMNSPNSLQKDAKPVVPKTDLELYTQVYPMWFANTMALGMRKQSSAMQTTASKIATNFPDKFMRSTKIMYRACGRTAGHVSKDLVKLLGYITGWK